MLIGAVLLVVGIALILWGAERFTDGAVKTATRFGVSAFYVGTVASGFEPENLATGVAASAGNLPQIALGSVIGSAIFMLTGGLGAALLLVPMSVRLPREGSVAMIASVVAFAVALWNDGTVSRPEGALLVLVAVGLMAWLYRRSAAFRRSAADDDGSSRLRVVGLLVLGMAVMIVGGELL